MSPLFCCYHLKKLHRSQVKILSFLSSFSTSASESRLTSSPPPIRIGITDSAGRGVFATRRIGAGDLIHTAKPIVSHPSLSSLHAVCYFCLRRLSNQNSCVDSSQIASFCSEQCEKESKNFYEVEMKADWSRFYEYCRMQGVKYPLLVKHSSLERRKSGRNGRSGSGTAMAVLLFRCGTSIVVPMKLNARNAALLRFCGRSAAFAAFR